MPLSEIIIRGMPTPTHPPDEDEPEVFDGFALVNRLLAARKAAKEATEERRDLESKIKEALEEANSIESQLVEAFRGSPVEAITFDYQYERFVLFPVNGKLAVYKSGYTHDLNPPAHRSFVIPADAATAIDDFDEPALMAVS